MITVNVAVSAVISYVRAMGVIRFVALVPPIVIRGVSVMVVTLNAVAVPSVRVDARAMGAKPGALQALPVFKDALAMAAVSYVRMMPAAPLTVRVEIVLPIARTLPSAVFVAAVIIV